MANLIETLSTTDGNQTSRVYDISRDINILTDFEAIVYNLAYTNAMSTHDARFQWDEKDLANCKSQINNSGGYNTTATSLVVDDGTAFTKYDYIRNLRTGETYQATNVSTNTLTVLRNVGSTGAVAINDDDVLLNIGPAYYENSTTPDVNMATTTTVYNYVQTFRRAWGVSGLKNRTLSTPGMSLAEIGVAEAREFIRDLEYAFIFGARDLNQADLPDNRYSTGGLDYFISTNETDVSGTLSETAWQTFLVDKAFSKGSKTKFMVCGDQFFKCLTYWADTYLQVGLEINSLGVSVGQYTAPTGETLYIYNHELFKGDTTLAGTGYVIDPANIRARYTENPADTAQNGMMVMKEGIQSNGTDGMINEYFAEMGLELRNETTHAVIKGVTGPATS